MLTQTQAQELWAGLKGDQSWTNLSHRTNDKADRHTKKAEFITHFGRAGVKKKKIQYVIQVGQKLLLPTKQVSSSLLHYGNERFNEKRSSRTEDTFLCRCSIKHAQTDWNPAR